MRRVLTPRWLLVHALAVLLAVGMLGLGGWQAARAASGNMLSWGYMLQWPVFAGFVVFIWTREIQRVVRDPDAQRSRSGSRGSPVPPRGQSARPAPRRPVITRPAAYDDAGDPDDPELAAYNRYLAWLNAHPRARTVDYPG